MFFVFVSMLVHFMFQLSTYYRGCPSGKRADPLDPGIPTYNVCFFRIAVLFSLFQDFHDH